MAIKNYRIEKYRKRSDWLNARCIGSTDLAKLVNKVARWGNFIELYDKLVGTDEEEIKENIYMARGKRAEEPIKELFLITHPNLKRINTKNSLWLIRRKDYPEITLSPDTLVNDEKGKLGYIEIKYKQITNERQINPYLLELKETEPQYYWQNVHHFVNMEDCEFGYLVVAFDLQRKNENTGLWEHDKYIIEFIKITREIVSEDIKIGEEALIDFIVNNLRPRKRPKTILKGTKGDNIEWNKLSSIHKLKK